MAKMIPSIASHVLRVQLHLTRCLISQHFKSVQLLIQVLALCHAAAVLKELEFKTLKMNSLVSQKLGYVIVSFKIKYLQIVSGSNKLMYS